MAYARTYDGPGFAGDLASLFRHQLAACALSEGELCLCITDTAWMPAYGSACMTAAGSLGARAIQLTLGWAAPPDAGALGAICAAADLIVYMTSHTLHYRPEIGRALAQGRRVLCCMEPPQVLDRLRFDPAVRDAARAGAALLGAAARVHVTSPVGTDLRMEMGDRRGLANYGAADEPGRLDFWALGAVQAAPREGTAEGTLVLGVGDGLFQLARLVEAPVTIRLEAGRIVAIEGGLDAFLLREALSEAGDEGAWAAGHMAWGVDPRARWTQPLALTSDAGGGADVESFAGAVQVQFGSNDDVAFGGRNRSRAHLGLCLRGATLRLDGRPVVADGRIV